jgi:hypothetical protein
MRAAHSPSTQPNLVIASEAKQSRSLRSPLIPDERLFLLASPIYPSGSEVILHRPIISDILVPQRFEEIDMTQDERDLLLLTARLIAEILENKSAKFADTSNDTDAIRGLVEKIAPK